MQILTTAVIKGGTGKTTTAAALAQAAAAAGKKVLAIDLDPQANFTFFIGADQNTPGSYQLLHGAEPGQLIQQTEQGIAAIAASPDLATERTTPASAKRLQQAIEPLKGKFDLIIIDTPPQMGELTFNALQAATGLIIPLETDSAPNAAQQPGVIYYRRYSDPIRQPPQTKPLFAGCDSRQGAGNRRTVPNGNTPRHSNPGGAGNAAINI